MSFVSSAKGCVIGVVLAFPVVAAPDLLADGVRQCGQQADEHQRLACFDQLASQLPSIQADQFGMTANIQKQRHPDAPDPSAAVLPAKIVALRQAPGGEWIFTLDNHQRWMQAEPIASMQFAVGESVRIEHGAMSSLWLAADKARKTRVRRVS